MTFETETRWVIARGRLKRERHAMSGANNRLCSGNGGRQSLLTLKSGRGGSSLKILERESGYSGGRRRVVCRERKLGLQSDTEGGRRVKDSIARNRARGVP